MTRIAIVVSSPVRPDTGPAIARGEAPRRDYFELRDMLGADLLHVSNQHGWIYRAAARLGGYSLMMALAAWAKRNSYDVILTDQEGIGLIFALLCKLTRTRVGHVMISHYLTPTVKQFFYRVLRVHTHINRTICYSTPQERLAREKLGLGADRVSMVLHPADSLFWRPPASVEEQEADARLLSAAGLDIPPDAPVVCSAGLEFRDYPTLMQAAQYLPTGTLVVIAAASPWSKRKNTAQGIELPENVRVVSLKPVQLRALYRRADVVAIPLQDVDFQAGSLVAYEAMACGRPVVITRSRGQVDIVREGLTGFYVPAGDAGAMAAALNRVLSDRQLAHELGRQARIVVEEGLNLDTYLRRMVEITREVAMTGAEQNATLNAPRLPLHPGGGGATHPTGGHFTT